MEGNYFDDEDFENWASKYGYGEDLNESLEGTFLDEFKFLTNEQGRSFMFTLEAVDFSEKPFVVYTFSEGGENEFFYTYELKKDVKEDAFLDGLFSAGIDGGAKGAEAFVKSFGIQIDKTSVKEVGL